MKLSVFQHTAKIRNKDIEEVLVNLLLIVEYYYIPINNITQIKILQITRVIWLDYNLGCPDFLSRLMKRLVHNITPPSQVECWRLLNNVEAWTSNAIDPIPIISLRLIWRYYSMKYLRNWCHMLLLNFCCQNSTSEFHHFATSLDQYQFCLNEKTIRVRVTLLKERVFIFLRPKRNILGITNEKTNWKKFWRFSD